MTKRTETPRELLTPAALHVLLSLAEEKRHGYGIKVDVDERTKGALRLGPGTLYEAIHRLSRLGFIEETRAPRERRPGKPRKYYRLTRAGRRQLEEELVRLRDIVRYADARDLLPDSK